MTFVGEKNTTQQLLIMCSMWILPEPDKNKNSSNVFLQSNWNFFLYPMNYRDYIVNRNFTKFFCSLFYIFLCDDDTRGFFDYYLNFLIEKNFNNQVWGSVVWCWECFLIEKWSWTIKFYIHWNSHCFELS